MATFSLHSKVTIEGFKPFQAINEVLIKKSLESPLDTATIKIPASARLKKGEIVKTESTQTANLFKRGDKVSIELGYNGILREEFTGFIKRVNFKTPCELECEGYGYLLKFKTINKTWQNTNLKKVLKELIADLDINLGEVDNIPFSHLQLINISALECLKKLKEYCGNTINIWFQHNTLNAVLKYTYFFNKNNKADVVYNLGYNTLGKESVKEREAGDNTVKINFYKKNKDGSKLEGNAGKEGGKYIQNNLQNIDSTKMLNTLAKNKEKEKNYGGLDGEIEAFLIPYCLPGYKVKIISKRYTELAGNYLVNSVTTSFSRNGARRKIKTSFRL